MQNTLSVLRFCNEQNKISASKLACCYLELQDLWKNSSNYFSPGSLVANFDQPNDRYLSSSVTKRQYFQNPTYETLELSLQTLKQHSTRRIIQSLVDPDFGCCCHQLHSSTVFSIVFKSFSGSRLIITNLQPWQQHHMPFQQLTAVSTSNDAFLGKIFTINWINLAILKLTLQNQFFKVKRSYRTWRSSVGSSNFMYFCLVPSMCR